MILDNLSLIDNGEEVSTAASQKITSSNPGFKECAGGLRAPRCLGDQQINSIKSCRAVLRGSSSPYKLRAVSVFLAGNLLERVQYRQWWAARS